METVQFFAFLFQTKFEMAEGIEATHRKALANVNVLQLTNETVGPILDGLRRKNGESYSGNYKSSLLSTIKKDNLNITITSKKLGWHRHRVPKKMTTEFVQLVIDLILYCERFEYNNYINLNRTQLDTQLAVLLATYLHCHVRNLFKLKRDDLAVLYTQKRINMQTGDVIIPSPQFTRVYPKIIQLLDLRAQLFSDVTKERVLSITIDPINKQIFTYIAMLLKTTGLIGLQNLSQDSTVQIMNKNTWGLNSFAKLPKDLLITMVGVKLAEMEQEDQKNTVFKQNNKQNNKQNLIMYEN